jgi:hypothetical protein
MDEHEERQMEAIRVRDEEDRFTRSNSELDRSAVKLDMDLQVRILAGVKMQSTNLLAGARDNSCLITIHQVLSGFCFMLRLSSSFLRFPGSL